MKNHIHSSCLYKWNKIYWYCLTQKWKMMPGRLQIQFMNLKKIWFQAYIVSKTATKRSIKINMSWAKLIFFSIITKCIHILTSLPRKVPKSLFFFALPNFFEWLIIYVYMFRNKEKISWIRRLINLRLKWKLETSFYWFHTTLYKNFMLTTIKFTFGCQYFS